MNLLLDTHAFLWFSENNPRLSKNSKSFIEDLNNVCFVSIASLWEMAIKVSLGKLDIKIGYGDLIDEIKSNEFKILPITH